MNRAQLLLSRSGDELDSNLSFDSNASTPVHNAGSRTQRGMPPLNLTNLRAHNRDHPPPPGAFPQTATPSPTMDKDFDDFDELFADIPVIDSARSDITASTISGSDLEDLFPPPPPQTQTQTQIQSQSQSQTKTQTQTRNSSAEVSSGKTTGVAMHPFPSRTTSAAHSTKHRLQPQTTGTAKKQQQQQAIRKSFSKRSNDSLFNHNGPLHTSSHHHHNHHAPHPLQPAPHPFQNTPYPTLKTMSSPVLRAFQQQPLRYFPSSAGILQQRSVGHRPHELRSESLEASTEGLREIRLKSMPRVKSFHAGSSSAPRSEDSFDMSVASSTLQPIYAFHNMNTMQQRLGVPHGRTPSGSQGGIMSNYIFYQHHPTYSLSMSCDVYHAGSALKDTLDSSMQKYAVMAKNVAEVGETHLSQLHQACIYQYDDVLTLLTTFPRNEPDRQQLESAMMARHSSSSAEDTLRANLVQISDTDTLSDSVVLENAPPLSDVRHAMATVELGSATSDSRHATLSGSGSLAYEEEDEFDDLMLSFDVSGEIEFDPHNPSNVLLRYFEITSAYSEVLQLEFKEHESLNLLLQCIANVVAFVKNHFNETSVPTKPTPEKIKLDEDSITKAERELQKLLKDYNSTTEIHLKLEDSLFICLDRLSTLPNLPLLYALTNTIRRLAVLLKCVNSLDSAAVMARTTVSIFQNLSSAFDEHRVDLASAYGLLGGILEDNNKGEEAQLMDRKALELTAQLTALSSMSANVVPFALSKEK